MSRSPEQAAAAPDAVAEYRQGWSALSELIGQGRSFSGYERNCAFLNVEGQRFANVSAATGLDLDDDTRAVATCDWDFDGRLDFWMTSRGGPRVRFLHNVSVPLEGEAGFVGIRLRGVQCNRDAIGARVELRVDGDPRPLIRTLHAGDGFLAQSSKWLHFGLARAEKITKVSVRWPGGGAESFEGVEPGRYWILEQGRGVALAREEKARPVKKADASVTVADSMASRSGATRTWIMGRVPMPSSDHPTGKRATLLNLWSSTCQACAAELHEWAEQETDLRQAGLEIVALSVDHLSGEGDEASKAGERLLDKINFPFVRAKASQSQVNAMEIVHRTYVELQKALPVPTSFLLDSQGRVAAIYKGRVGVKTLLADVALIDADLGKQREMAVPYRGRWASTPFPADPNRVAVAFEKAGQTEQAIEYLKQFLAGARDYLEGQYGSQESKLQTVAVSHQWLGDHLLKLRRAQEAAQVYANLLRIAPKNVVLHQSIGEQLLSANLAKEALPHLQLAVKAFPENANLQFNAGLASLGAGQPEKALAHLQRFLSQSPGDAAAHYQIAVALEQTKRAKEAATHYRAALRSKPGWPIAASKLVDLILESDRSAPLGTVAEAQALATGLVEASSRRDPMALYSMIRVQVWARQTAEAVRLIEEALPLAGALGPRYAKLVEALRGLRKSLGQER